eukprot:TRINITY_DN18874_c0_g1_i1.p1 TRINITY_DN18874_c0_g1~~TRINITY_DN18874_c0_g1_i1.p1  ORF type:complete len:422 (+),score=110.46 TRINITY_DN18874_c0_g1_i1:2-1267(+)
MPRRRSRRERDEEEQQGEKGGEEKGGGEKGESSRQSKRPRVASTPTEAPYGAWTTEGSLCVFQCGDPKPLTKVVALDLDGTVITTKSGRAFPTGRSDWVFLFPNVPDILRQRFHDGYAIVFMSNQKGISSGKQDEAQLRGKLEDIAKQLDLPLRAYLATEDDGFRKPATGMWDYFVKPELQECMYVGDAAGRVAGWMPKKKKDFSASDRKFAFNSGIAFNTPEEFFQGAAPVPESKWEWGSYDPKEAPRTGPVSDIDGPLHSTEQEVVVFVGPPASGKSTFFHRHMAPHGYVHINRDTVKTAARCMALCADSLAKGKSVVIDNTSPSVDKRQPFIDVAKKHNISARCFWFQTPIDLAHHLNRVREIQSKGAQPHVPDVGFNMFKKYFQQPDKGEGFSEIRKIAFVATFDEYANEQTFLHWT